MKNYEVVSSCRLAGLALIFFSCLPANLTAQIWQKPAQPELRAPFQDMTGYPGRPGQLLIASGSQILAGSSKGPWKPVISPKPAPRIFRLLTFPELTDTVFVLAEEGLFLGRLSDPSWEHLRTNLRGERILSLTLLPEDPNHWIAGTETGLYESDNAGKTWHRFDVFARRAPVRFVEFADESLFVSAGNTLLRSDDLTTFRELLALPRRGSTDAGEEGRSNSCQGVQAFEAPRPSSMPMWLASCRGVFESRDRGDSWHPLSSSGLQSRRINSLVYSEHSEKLIAGTARGVYVYKPRLRTWEEIYRGLSHTQTRALALHGRNPEKLIALTADGLLYYRLMPHPTIEVPEARHSSGTARLFQTLVAREPTVRQIHESVMDYANVRPDKTRRWQRQSRASALLPRLSWGYDFRRSNNIDLDRGSTSIPDRYISGPEDLSNNWGFDVRWDLADLIWSSSQTSIDSREKLMVDLRRDLLAEATRLYFERRRLQTELALKPAGNAHEYLNSLTRLDELTAHLDAMTGGFMSRELRKIYATHPELETLWQYGARGVGHGQKE